MPSALAPAAAQHRDSHATPHRSDKRSPPLTGVAVTYYCPACGALAELDRDASLADRSVTPYPLDGWEYATPDEKYENADGVLFVCGEAFYLSFIRFEGGEEVEPRPPAEYVEIGVGFGPHGPREPDRPE